MEGAQADAIKLYRMGLNIVQEGLSLQVQSSGLGPGYSNVARWRDNMSTWKQLAGSRYAVDVITHRHCMALCTGVLINAVDRESLCVKG